MNNWGAVQIVKTFLRLIVAVCLGLFAAAGMAATHYVVTNNPTAANPYTNWTMAGTSLVDVVNAAMTNTEPRVVWVTNGTYVLTNTVTITNGVTVQSVNGCDVTTVDGNNAQQCFSLNHSSAVVAGFTIQKGSGSAGGVYIQSGGGTVSNCILRNNYGSGYHCSGAVKIAAISGATNALISNCLIISNYSAYNGGILCESGSWKIESCTITRNWATTYEGGGLFSYGGGTVYNSIIYDNWNTRFGWESNLYVSGTSPQVSNSCITPFQSGNGNIAANPLFVNVDAYDCRLLPGSPCINAGTNQVWMTGAKDLGGVNDRIIHVIVDIGAYEFQTNGLACGFTANPVEGFAPLQVVFTSSVAGTNTTGLAYYWAYTNGGVQESGSDKQVVTNAYAAGTYSVSLTVSNAIGEMNTYTRTNYIKAGPATNFVATNATGGFPYTNWATASSNIQLAVDAGVGGTVVLVTNGNYVLTNMISITRGVTVRSVNGYSVTTVDGSNSVSCFYLNHSNAVVDGFRITQGKNQVVSISGGAGGVLIYPDGTLQNCVINNCFSSGSGESAGGVNVFSRGTVRNCLIYSNYYGLAGGIYLTGWGAALIENCTITSNSNNNAANPGGIRLANNAVRATVRNTIVYDNTNRVAGGNANWTNVANYNTSLYNNCLSPAAIVGTGNITNDPQFINPADANFHLPRGSPCVNTGTNQSWMSTGQDLDGYVRIMQHFVDMGAYEYQLPRGTVFSIRGN